MLGFLGSLLGSGVVGSLERVALEAIETDTESAEAKVLKIKALDPNGKMRRDLSRFASYAYGFYLFAMVILIFLYSFKVGDPTQSKEAITAMAELFLPITGAWTAIVGASFGTNVSNNWKDVKKNGTDE